MNIHQEYLDKGWTAPIPIPEGAKYPPPNKTTGDIPQIKKSKIESLWLDAPQNSNTALRMQIDHPKYDIIGIDIDQYGNKRGRDHIRQMEKELGTLDLENVPCCSRRGVDSLSGQRYFLVPKGIKWKAFACTDVEILQISHRYAVVYPSIVDGEQYIWFQNGEQIDIPNVNDLPVLPDPWVNALTRGKRSKFGTRSLKSNFDKQSGLDDQYLAAVEWLRTNMFGWDNAGEAEDSRSHISGQMDTITSPDRLVDLFQANSHDSMVSVIHAAVMLSVEGHVGLKIALHRIKKTFLEEVTSRDDGTARSQAVAQREFKRALVGEVDRLINEVDQGNIVLTGDPKDLALPNFISNLVRDESFKRPDTINPYDYTDDDRGHAQAFVDYWGVDVLATDDRDEKFAVWLDKKGRYLFRRTEQMFGHVVAAIPDRLTRVAEDYIAQANAIEARMGEGQVPEDTPDPDEVRAEGFKLLDRASKTRGTVVMKNILAQLPSMPQIGVERMAFDSNPGIMGAANSETIELERIHEMVPVRPSKQSDMLTFSTAVSVQPEAQNDVWDNFLKKHLPDPALRRFVQKVIGYCLEDGNPEKILPILWGETNTGKTAVLEACKSALGDYGGTVPITKLFGSRDGAPNPELLSVMRKRMVTLSEVGSDETLSASALKRITGNDQLMARKNHSNEVPEQRPLFTPYMSTNSIPNIRGGDAATKGRLLILPFRVQGRPGRTTAENDIVNNPKVQSAVLWWIIEGFRMYREEGLHKDTWPEEVLQLSDEFMSGTSDYHAFLEEKFVEDSDARCPVDAVWKSWEAWCAKQNIDRRTMGTRKEFEARMKANGFTRFRTTYPGYDKKVMCFRGISPRTE